MKQFRDLMQAAKVKQQEQPGRVTRTMSFQSLAGKKQQSLNINHPKHERKLPEQQMTQQHEQASLEELRAAREERLNRTPMLKVRRCNLKQLREEPQRIQGVQVATSMTVSVESVHHPQKENVQPNADRLNTEQCEEISDRLTSIKDNLIRGVVQKTREGSDINSVLANMRQQLDWKTQLVVEEVLAKRKNKQVYGRARQDVKSYFSKKKEQREEYKREKTLGTPCFEQPSNYKHQSSNKTTNHNTVESKKSPESTALKITVLRKESAGRHKSFKDVIELHRRPLEDVRVQQFTLE